MRTRRYSGHRSPLPTLGKVFFSVVGVAVLLCVCLLLFFVITEYRPDEITRLEVTGFSGPQSVRVGEACSALTFNIGYCGLDASRDLYAEGGAGSAAGSRADVEGNLEAVSGLLKARAPMFAFLQDVDVNSRRSFGVNQQAALEALLPGRAASFALTQKSPFVPLPLGAPTGRVECGLLSLSSVAVRESTRRRFDSEAAFPGRLFTPNDCFLVTRVAADNGGELVLINARFSADSGTRADQLAQMGIFLEQEAEKGHYIILSGDWNGRLLALDSDGAGGTAPPPAWSAGLSRDFVPEGFHWAVDPELPTRRACGKPYAKGESYTALTDGFLLSDNIEAQLVRTLDLDFRNANHNPVLLTFTLLP